MEGVGQEKQQQDSCSQQQPCVGKVRSKFRILIGIYEVKSINTVKFNSQLPCFHVIVKRTYEMFQKSIKYQSGVFLSTGLEGIN